MVNVQLTVTNSQLNEIKQKFQGISASHHDLGGRGSPCLQCSSSGTGSFLTARGILSLMEWLGHKVMGGEELSLTGLDRAGNRR